MTDDMITRPTIETVLERIGAFDQKVDDRMSALERKIDAVERKVDERIDAFEKKVDERIDALERKVDERFDQVNARFSLVDNEIDRLASVAHSTKAEMHTLRLDFREMRAQLKEALPVLQES
jgi:chromosome segregation ATPase